MIYFFTIGLLVLLFGFCFWIYDTIKILKDLKDKIVFLDKFTQNKNLYICFNSNKLNNKILKDFNNGMSKINKDQFYFDYLIFNF